MADMFSKDRRSEIMRRIAGKNTQPELRVRRLLHALGFRFRLHRKDLPGNPDIVFPKRKTVIFVHGCFWHGHNCRKGSARRRPKSNAAYWNMKLDRNIRRDKDNAKRLNRLGWKRIIIWSCETNDLNRLEKLLLSSLQEAPRRRS
jgi:DNA mismatch endonuclease (patch repair protein)